MKRALLVVALGLVAAGMARAAEPGKKETITECKDRVQQRIDSVDAQARQRSTEYLRALRKRLEDERDACGKSKARQG